MSHTPLTTDHIPHKNAPSVNVAQEHAPSRPRGNYGPRGMTRPISLRLMPEERLDIERIAHEEGRAVSPTCRMLCLKGLRVYRQERADMARRFGQHDKNDS